jgi:hypothetical protein
MNIALPHIPVHRRTLFMAGLGLISVAGDARAEGADKPALEVGDRWDWQHRNVIANQKDYTLIHDVIAVSANEVRIRVRKKGTTVSFIQTFTPELNPLDTGEAKWSPNLERFSFPLVPGKKWNITCDKMIIISGKHGVFHGKAEVSGPEKITVEAGEFQAYKIALTLTGESADENAVTGRTDENFWYAPEVRNCVKYDTKFTLAREVRNQDSYELLEYSLR